MIRKWYRIPKENRQLIGIFLLALITVAGVFALSYLGMILTVKFS